MHDVVIVGGGLCGLALAQGLQARGLDWQLAEARPRLGGRVLTHLPTHGPALDLGPTWFWPGHQPGMQRLVEDLKLATTPQADDGWVQLLDDPEKGPRRVAVGVQADGTLAHTEQPTPGAVHGGAQRLVDGMAALITALASWLPRERLHAGLQLTEVQDGGDHVVLTLMQGTQRRVWRARQVVLALPPRLVDEHIRFSPELPAELREAMRATSTWMATAAKAALAAPPGRPAPWRADGHPGNAWVQHPQAVLAEVFDIGVKGDGDALAAFVALGVAQRRQFAAGLPLLMGNQLEQLWGPEASEGEWRRQDWADEPHTCAALDLAEDGQTPHPGWSSEWLRQAHWEGRLLLGGSETARQGNGYLEGALNAAGRLKRQIAERSAQAAANDAAIKAFGDWVQTQRSEALTRYRSRLTQALSAQVDAPLTQTSVLGALESLYADALAQLDALPLSLQGMPVAQGRAALTPPLLAPFGGLSEELLQQALRFNAGSCALSNFPAEHRPAPDYLGAIQRDLAAAWRAFALDLNQRLVERAGLAATP